MAVQSKLTTKTSSRKRPNAFFKRRSIQSGVQMAQTIPKAATEKTALIPSIRMSAKRRMNQSVSSDHGRLPEGVGRQSRREPGFCSNAG